MTVIAVDTGNRMIKTAHAEPFSAGLNRHMNISPAISVDQIKYQNNYYTFSETQDTHRYDKTKDDQYLILCQAAIARELIMKRAMLSSEMHSPISFAKAMRQAEQQKETYAENIVLSMGLPPSHLGALKDRYKSFFGNQGQPFEFTYNGLRFDVSVKEVMVWAQGFAALMSGDYYSLVQKEPQALLIDIGGYTTEVILLVYGNVDMKVCQSFNMGVIHLYNLISRRILEECQAEIPSVMVEAVLRGKEIHDTKAQAIIKESASRYASEIVRSLEDKRIDLKFSLPVLIGGGSTLLKPALEAAINRHDIQFIPDIRANAIGYEKCAYKAIKKYGLGQ